MTTWVDGEGEITVRDAGPPYIRLPRDEWVGNKDKLVTAIAQVFVHAAKIYPELPHTRWSP
jgi:hypothetical protein